GCMNAKQLAGLLQRQVFGKNRFEPGDPVRAFARFAVRNALECGTERRTHSFEHSAPIGERNTADKMDVAHAARSRLRNEARLRTAIPMTRRGLKDFVPHCGSRVV